MLRGAFRLVVEKRHGRVIVTAQKKIPSGSWVREKQIDLGRRDLRSSPVTLAELSVLGIDEPVQPGPE